MSQHVLNQLVIGIQDQSLANTAEHGWIHTIHIVHLHHILHPAVLLGYRDHGRQLSVF